jgi:hypothetical protein
MGKTKRSCQKEVSSELKLREVEKSQPQPRTRGASSRTTYEHYLRNIETDNLQIFIPKKTQKNYWLLTDQIIPSKHNFRDNVKEKYEQDWRKIDLLKLYIQACMEYFQWRSAHRKLYAKRDLVRFGYTQEASCTCCYKPQQTIGHLYTECGRDQLLFKNFEKHYKLDTELTWCEKMIGIDTNVPR